MADAVNHPRHYNALGATCSRCGHPIECIDVVRHMGFNDGNAVKYLWRREHKGALEDLRKARWYLDDLIRELERNEAKDEKPYCEGWNPIESFEKTVFRFGEPLLLKWRNGSVTKWIVGWRAGGASERVGNNLESIGVSWWKRDDGSDPI